MAVSERKIRQLQDPRLPAVTVFTNTLYVDPEGDDVSAAKEGVAAQFKSIRAAIKAARAGDVIVLGPGTFEEDVTLKSAINIRALERTRTIIKGDVKWIPTTTPPQADMVEDRSSPGSFSDLVTLEGLTITGTLTLDGSQKADNTAFSVLVCRDVNVTAIDVIGNADGSRVAWVDYVHGGSFDEGGAPDVTLSGGDGAAFLTRAASIGRLDAPNGFVVLQKSDVGNTANISGTCSFTAFDTHFFDNVNFESSQNGTMGGCVVDGEISVSDPSQLDARGSTYKTAPSGDGKLETDTIVGTLTTGAGDADTTVTFAVPRQSTHYEVFLTEKAATPGASLPSIKSKATTGFVVHDAVGGRNFAFLAVAVPQAAGPS